MGRYTRPTRTPVFRVSSSLIALLKPYLLLTRPFMSATPAVGTIIAAQVSAPGAGLSLPAITLGLANSCLSAASMVINDLLDVEVDKINKPYRPIPSGQVSKNQALAFALALFAFGWLASFFVSPGHGLGAVLVTSLSVAYSLRLRRYLLIGNVLVAAVSCYPLFAGGLLMQAFDRLTLPLIAVFLFITGREMLKDAEDVAGDSRFKNSSIANMWGTPAAIYAGLALIGLALVAALGQYVRNINGEWYLVSMAPPVLAAIIMAYRLIRIQTTKALAQALDISAVVLLWSSLALVVNLR